GLASPVAVAAAGAPTLRELSGAKFFVLSQRASGVENLINCYAEHFWSGEQFLKELASQLIHELQPNHSIKTFADNTAIKGAFAEATLRQFVSRVVAPLRVSTGAVISEELCDNPKKVPQIDLIIWAPSPAPAIFCSGDFALVPRSSCFGVMEIKRSLYSDAGKRIGDVVGNAQAYKLVSGVARDIQFDPARTSDADFTVYPGLGVVCIHEYDQSNQTQYAELEQEGLSLTLFHENSDGKLDPNPKAVFRLINFLTLTKLRARIMEGRDLVDVRLLNADGVEVALADVSASQSIESPPKMMVSLGPVSSTNTPFVIGPVGGRPRDKS
ncbi:MAG TPA: hypothetical protein VFD58_10260, partial [Blastocatellia bacterium]|nr:hypothetical protein [Blastocatellia bacterium]